MDEKRELDDFLDGALGQLGGILGELGYVPPPPSLGTLDAPSGALALCDLGALPTQPRRGRFFAQSRGTRVTRGLVAERPVSTWAALCPESIPGGVQHLFLAARLGEPATRERVLGVIWPQTGVLLVADRTVFEKLAAGPRRAPPPLVKGFGPQETARRQAREAGARLTPTALKMLDAACRSGAWSGVVEGRDALVAVMGTRHPLRLREGLDAEGRTCYLRIDVLLDGVQADSKLRAMARRGE